MAGLINWKKVSIPGINPDSGHMFVGVDIADNKFYLKNDTGTIVKFADALDLSNYDLSTVVDSKISNAINNLIGGAPAALDTLNELAAAMADDAAFSVTINNLITANASAIALKYDASNPNGYETPAQLNTRDTNNRNRSNHTGSQLAATISDFAASVRAVIVTGINVALAGTVTGTDTVLEALGKLQKQITDILSSKADKIIDLTAGSGLSGGGDLSANRTFNVNVQNSVEIVSDNVQLVNDVASAGNRKFYGTDTVGAKGYQDLDTAIARYLDKSAFEDDTFYVNTTNDFTTDPNAIAVDQDITPIHTATYLVEVDFIYSCDSTAINGEVELLIDGVIRKRHEEEMNDSGGTEGASGTDHRITGTFSTLVSATASVPFNIEIRHRAETNAIASTIKASTVKVQRWLQV